MSRNVTWIVQKLYRIWACSDVTCTVAGNIDDSWWMLIFICSYQGYTDIWIRLSKVLLKLYLGKGVGYLRLNSYLVKSSYFSLYSCLMSSLNNVHVLIRANYHWREARSLGKVRKSRSLYSLIDNCDCKLHKEDLPWNRTHCCYNITVKWYDSLGYRCKLIIL